jgi:prepilin-type N-terminal cleavage/methylation domain-containing protein
MLFKSKSQTKAFTLLEILLVVGIIAILAGIVIVAINPSKQIATVRNTQRLSDIKQINSALQQYYINNGSYPNSLLGDLTEICDTGALATTTNSDVTCDGLIDLTVLVPTYLAAIPKDPLATTTAYTGYQVIKGSTSGLISLNAEHSELGQTIVLGKEAGGGAVSTLGNGLIAHYKMNDADCSTVEDTKGNDGSGTCTADPSGVIGGALGLNGSSDYISATTFKGLPLPFSISLWFKTSGSNFEECMINWGSTDGLVEFGFIDNLLSLNSNTGGSWSPDSGRLPGLRDGAWHYGVLAINISGDASLWIDGDLKTAATGLGTDVIDDDGPFLTLGMRATYSDSPFNGSLDDVRIYNRALTGPETDCTDESDTEVCQIWNDGAGTEAE